MNNNNNILDTIGRTDGMTVPDGYFDNFAALMMKKLPEHQSNDIPEKRTLWLKVRPYVYLAAMFAGIFCMMELFSTIKNPSTDLNINNFPALTATLENGALDCDIIFDIDEYDLLDDIYNEGYSVDEIILPDDSLAAEDNTI
ncbi:MAG: hypothetical protein NC311_18760 [Muribaculaceae bacterium]|nr:hypothetical protein [Muribaculaceae bacterium]